MSERVVVSLTTGSASPSNLGPRSARFFIVGQTQFGKDDGPAVVRSLSEYVAEYGARTGGAAMYDAAEMFLDRARAGELVVMRATGPSAVKSTITLDSKITVTAKYAGAYYDAWTAAYTSSTTTLTIVKGSTTVNYVGATAAALEAAAAVDPDVDVSVTALPAGDVTATALASGADDYSNVVWATTLALIPDSFGPGAIATPGVAYGTTGSALASHAKNNRRLALIAESAATTAAGVVTAAGTASAYTGAENTVLVWPHVKVSDGANGVKTISPESYAAALRSIAQRQYGIGVSPLQREIGARVTGVTPEFSVGSTDWDTVNDAHVASVRTLALGTQLDGWETLAAPSGNVNLFGAQFRDMVNAAAADCSDVLERFVGRPGSSAVLAQAASELSGVLEDYTPYLSPEYDANGSLIHPGYKVIVDNGTNPADNRIRATVSMRFVEYADFVDFTIAAYDAGATI